jgi:acyl-CoA thioester hydrolase
VTSENLETVKRIWDAWTSGDTDSVLDLYDRDLVWDVTAMGVGEERYFGVAGARQQRKDWADVFGQLRIEAEYFSEVGPAVIARVHQSGQGARSGAAAGMTFWQVWEVRDGKVTRVTIFNEEAPAVQLAESLGDTPPPKPFVHRHRVRYLECDMQGVVAHPNYLGFFDWAMTEMWREAIGPYQEMVDSGVDLVIAETNYRYLSPARFDEDLDIEVSVRHIGNSSLIIAFSGSVDGRPVIQGENRYVAVATGSHEKMSIPDAIREGLEPYRLEPVSG